jgi:flagellar protein FlaG
MLIQNVSSNVPVSGFASDGGAVPVAAHPAVDLPAVKVPQGQPVQPTDAQLKSAVDAINRAMQQSNANVEFSIDKETQQTVIKVVELGSGNVIRQFPTEEILAVSRMIAEAQRGVLLKQQA